MEKFNRAVRRHHITRLKNTRKAYWAYGFAQTQMTWETQGDKRERVLATQPGRNWMTPRQLGKVVQYPQVCSCFGCGNPRHHFDGEKVSWISLLSMHDSEE